MTTPLLCLLFIIAIPFILAGIGGYFRTRQLGSLDNRHPRDQASELNGAGARVYAAQQNAWEATAVFTAAVLTAHVVGADPAMSGWLAMAFVGFRVLHVIFYLADLPTIRSLTFVAGLISAVWLFLLGPAGSG